MEPIVVEEVTSWECSETDIFNSAVSMHSDISTVECLSFQSGEIQLTEWREVFFKVGSLAKKRWQGIQLISIYYRFEKPGQQSSFAAIAVSGDSVSLSMTVLAFIIDYIKKIKDNKEVMEELNDSEEESDDEQIVAPPELVHIKVTHGEMDNWIKSFIQGKRNLINKQNIVNFCVEENTRENCARIDAVMVKRKGTSSHIKVQDIENYWGQEVKKFPHINQVPIRDTPQINKKHSFTAVELSSKLAQFEDKMIKIPRMYDDLGDT